MAIVGYYHANERYDDNEVSGVAMKFADKISASYRPSNFTFLQVFSLDYFDFLGSFICQTDPQLEVAKRNLEQKYHDSCCCGDCPLFIFLH